MNIKWDADKYTADFSFVHQYGNSVMELIDANKGSSVLDLGCGNGALTKKLQEKEAIIDKAVEILQDDLYIDGKWYADYVRIRMKAIRL